MSDDRVLNVLIDFYRVYVQLPEDWKTARLNLYAKELIDSYSEVYGALDAEIKFLFINDFAFGSIFSKKKEQLTIFTYLLNYFDYSLFKHISNPWNGVEDILTFKASAEKIDSILDGAKKLSGEKKKIRLHIIKYLVALYGFDNNCLLDKLPMINALIIPSDLDDKELTVAKGIYDEARLLLFLRSDKYDAFRKGVKDLADEVQTHIPPKR